MDTFCPKAIFVEVFAKGRTTFQDLGFSDFDVVVFFDGEIGGKKRGVCGIRDRNVQLNTNELAIFYTYSVYKVQLGIVVASLYIYVFSDIVVFLVGVFECYIDDLGRVALLAGYKTEVWTNFIQMNTVKLVVEGVYKTFQIVIAILVTEGKALAGITVTDADVLRVDGRNITIHDYHLIYIVTQLECLSNTFFEKHD